MLQREQDSTQFAGANWVAVKGALIFEGTSSNLAKLWFHFPVPNTWSSFLLYMFLLALSGLLWFVFLIDWSLWPWVSQSSFMTSQSISQQCACSILHSIKCAHSLPLHPTRRKMNQKNNKGELETGYQTQWSNSIFTLSNYERTAWHLSDYSSCLWL